MRIAIFTNTFWPTVNGVAISIANLRRGLSAQGHEPYVFAPAPPGFDVSQDEPNVIRYPAFPAPVEADYQLAMPLSAAVTKTLRGLEFDLVHTHHPMWVGSWGQWYARWNNVPLVTTIHTQYEIYSKLIPLPDTLVEAYLRAQVSSYCNKCQLVTTPAPSARERLLALGVTTPIRVIVNPTDLSACLVASGAGVRERLGWESADLRVLGYVGRLAPEKNLPALLDAMREVMVVCPEVRLLIVGDGPSRDELESMARALPNPEGVAFVGRVPHAEVPEYQAALDLFVTPSMMEVQPLSFAEAFATGAPIVAFNVAGNNDMIIDGTTGRLVPPDAGAKGLAATIIDLLGHPEEVSRLSAAAREAAVSYDLPAVTSRMLQAYEETIALAKTQREGG